MPSPEGQGQGQRHRVVPERTGQPDLAGATAVIECELWREYEGGDHAIMVGKVHNLIVPEEAPRPMVYCRGRMASLPAFA